jgi:hypothetical protein
MYIYAWVSNFSPFGLLNLEILSFVGCNFAFFQDFGIYDWFLGVNGRFLVEIQKTVDSLYSDCISPTSPKILASIGYNDFEICCFPVNLFDAILNEKDDDFWQLFGLLGGCSVEIQKIEAVRSSSCISPTNSEILVSIGRNTWRCDVHA